MTLAATSRQFNYLSLQVFFSNHNFDPTNSKLIIAPENSNYVGFLHKITALAMSLALQRTSVEDLLVGVGYIRSPELVLHEIRTLTRYIMSLSTINRVTIRIEIPSGFPITMAACNTLLYTLIGKSCNHFHIKGEVSQYWVARQRLRDLFSSYKTSVISKFSNWRRRRDSGYVLKSNTETKYLKQCIIQSLPTFLRPFYFQVLKVNASVLTGLAFRSIFNPADLGLLLTNVHLPALEIFAMSWCTIPHNAIITFLSKHSHITAFQYYHITYRTERKVPRRLEGGLDCLESLTTGPKQIFTFIPSMDRMPSIASIAINMEEDFLKFDVVQEALRHLSSCVNKIDLTLYTCFVSRTFGLWLPELVHPQSSFWRGNEIMLHCVESLHLQNGDWGYADSVLDRLPALLRLFPELKHLILHSGRPSSARQLSEVEERNTLLPFFEQVKLVCPTIRVVVIQGDSEWTHIHTYRFRYL